MDIKRKNTQTLQSFEKLFKSFYPKLCLFASKYLIDIKTSEDTVQEVFIKVWEKKIVFTCEDDASRFLYTAVKNKAIDYLRSKNFKDITPHLPEEIDLLINSEQKFNSEIAILEASEMINNAINGLPPQRKKIMLLSYSGHSNKEIADILKVGAETVKSHKKEAYKKIRKDLMHSNNSNTL
ncbi:MAG TPA: RNA polymerase sigma-70 factor [Flavobacteriaceae bacterium]|nr:RNA polymerase sigma-70 factor [Flavobacteriaceae bacterium]